MAFLFWDASALAKRYTAEDGTATTNALFAQVPRTNMSTTPWGYAETYSILLRRHNSGVLDVPAFTASASALQAEIVNDPDFTLLSVTDTTIMGCTSVMHRHNINSTDASILAMLLALAPSPPPDFVVVAADKRLLRAAAQEGFKTLDPALIPAADVPSFLASL